MTKPNIVLQLDLAILSLEETIDLYPRCKDEIDGQLRIADAKCSESYDLAIEDCK